MTHFWLFSFYWLRFATCRVRWITITISNKKKVNHLRKIFLLFTHIFFSSKYYRILNVGIFIIENSNLSLPLLCERVTHSIRVVKMSQLCPFGLVPKWTELASTFFIFSSFYLNKKLIKIINLLKKRDKDMNLDI